VTLSYGDIYEEPGTKQLWSVVGWGSLQESHDTVVRLIHDKESGMYERIVYSGDFIHAWRCVKSHRNTKRVHVGGPLSFDPAGPLKDRRP
jgi:hypothetical protein